MARRRKERQNLLHSGGWAAKARRAKIRVKRSINLADYDQRHGTENSADAISRPARFGRFSAGLRDAQVLRLGAGSDPWSRPVHGLHDGAPEHERA